MQSKAVFVLAVFSILLVFGRVKSIGDNQEPVEIKEILAIQRSDPILSSAAIMPNGETLVWAEGPSKVVLWDAHQRQEHILSAEAVSKLPLLGPALGVVAVAPNNNLLEKLKSNLQEVKARGGKLYLFADKTSEVESTDGVFVLKINAVYDFMAPILYTIPLQLLAYYVAVIKGADIDQPRNLAKSVTVE